MNPTSGSFDDLSDDRDLQESAEAHEEALDQADELLEFLPLFEQQGTDWIQSCDKDDPPRDDVHSATNPYPVYREEVLEFFMRAGHPRWSDTRYSPTEAGKMLADDDRVARASLSEFKTMLTYCVRGERFADGHWYRMLREGRVVALLRRLSLLKPATERVGPGDVTGSE